ncbi:metal ABC transporter permease [Helicobacter himalayensis]|uniref:metal ABC transporter permease n=1 Tax=Helicobacter himalayensis TaxID=1591088 RepID=UPI003D6FFF34
MLEILEFSFFQNALLCAVLTSIACGIVGALAMINRLISLAGGITHGAFGGIGVAFYFGLPLLLSVSIWTLLLALFLGFIMQRYPNRSENIIAVIWAFGMAFGLILLDLTPGYKSDIMGYLFGSILAIAPSDLVLLGVCDGVFIVLILCFYRQFEALSFDFEFTKLQGVNARAFYYLFIIMIAFCIVLSIRVVGLILVIALLSIPCFIAENFTKRLGSMIFCSILLSAFFCISGLFVSYFYNLTSGASIIIIASIAFGICVALKSFYKLRA